jgi:hypothetical protein
VISSGTTNAKTDRTCHATRREAKSRTPHQRIADFSKKALTRCALSGFSDTREGRTIAPEVSNQHE